MKLRDAIISDIEIKTLNNRIMTENDDLVTEQVDYLLGKKLEKLTKMCLAIADKFYPGIAQERGRLLRCCAGSIEMQLGSTPDNLAALRPQEAHRLREEAISILKYHPVEKAICAILERKNRTNESTLKTIMEKTQDSIEGS